MSDARVIIVASDAATANRLNEMFRRVRECMFAYDRYMHVCIAADENNAADMEGVAAASFEMAKRVAQQYPDAAQFDADLETLKQMRTRIA